MYALRYHALANGLRKLYHRVGFEFQTRQAASKAPSYTAIRAQTARLQFTSEMTQEFTRGFTFELANKSSDP